MFLIHKFKTLDVGSYQTSPNRTPGEEQVLTYLPDVTPHHSGTIHLPPHFSVSH